MISPACSKRVKSQYASTYQAFACITFINTQLAQASHMVKSKVTVGGDYTKMQMPEIWFIRDNYYHNLPNVYYNYFVNCKESDKYKNCNIKSSEIVKVIIKIVKVINLK